jgi:aminobenzoyl-glutamate utilization protein B
MNYGVNLMREHVKPTTRIHYVIEDGGNAPNVVPDYAKVWYYVRDINRDQVDGYYQRILKIAEGAAMGTETTHTVHLTTGVHERLLIRPLQEAVQANMETVGAPNFNEEDQQFAHAMQQFIDADQDGFSTELKPLADGPEEPSGGSTDVAEVSYSAPTVGFRVATTPQNVPWHSWCVSASHGTDAAIKGGDVATQVIALTGYDMLTDTNLLEQAQATFDELTNGEPYESPIPEDQAPPVPPTSSR